MTDFERLTKFQEMSEEHKITFLIAILTEVQKERFLMKYIDGYSINKIAEIEGRNSSSISRCINSAEKLLDKYLEIEDFLNNETAG